MIRKPLPPLKHFLIALYDKVKCFLKVSLYFNTIYINLYRSVIDIILLSKIKAKSRNENIFLKKI